jgi:hypothetical protein
MHGRRRKWETGELVGLAMRQVAVKWDTTGERRALE